MAFCTGCGNQVPDDVKFCTECGNPMNETSPHTPVIAETEATPPPQPTPAASTQASYTKPSSSEDAPPPRGSRYAVMSTKAYIGHTLLFAIPGIGWIICLIMAFAAKSLNKRNFAKALIIFFLIGIILSVIMYFIFFWFSASIIPHIRDFTDMFTN